MIAPMDKRQPTDGRAHVYKRGNSWYYFWRADRRTQGGGCSPTLNDAITAAKKGLAR